MMHVDTDPDTQVRQFNRFSLQFILAIAIPKLIWIFEITSTTVPITHLQN